MTWIARNLSQTPFCTPIDIQATIMYPAGTSMSSAGAFPTQSEAIVIAATKLLTMQHRLSPDEAPSQT